MTDEQIHELIDNLNVVAAANLGLSLDDTPSDEQCEILSRAFLSLAIAYDVTRDLRLAGAELERTAEIRE